MRRGGLRSATNQMGEALARERIAFSRSVRWPNARLMFSAVEDGVHDELCRTDRRPATEKPGANELTWYSSAVGINRQGQQHRAPPVPRHVVQEAATGADRRRLRDAAVMEHRVPLAVDHPAHVGSDTKCKGVVCWPTTNPVVHAWGSLQYAVTWLSPS